MEQNTIYNCDCFDLIKQFPSDFVDLTLTDIPYGEVNRKDNGLRNLNKGKADIVNFSLKFLVEELCRITSGSMYIFCGINQVSEIRQIMSNNGLSTRLCIWEKTNPSPMNGTKIWLSGVECFVFGKKKGAVFNEHCKNTVFRYPCGRNKLHPTQKPITLIERLICASSIENSLIFDPFLGSGTTAVAAVKTNRKYIGCEIDDNYFEIACKRLDEIEGKDDENEQKFVCKQDEVAR